MKKVITAIGNEKLNNILRENNIVKVLNQDIQYQDGIFEALEKYKDVDTLIINEGIIGSLEITDLIRTVKIIREDLEVLLISKGIRSIDRSNCIAKIIDHNIDYVTEVVKYFRSNEDIKQIIKIKDNQEKLTQPRQMPKMLEESRKTGHMKNVRYKEKKVKIRGNIITVIGNAGVR